VDQVNRASGCCGIAENQRALHGRGGEVLQRPDVSAVEATESREWEEEARASSVRSGIPGWLLKCWVHL
jgi:hypothetical protein